MIKLKYRFKTFFLIILVIFSCYEDKNINEKIYEVNADNPFEIIDLSYHYDFPWTDAYITTGWVDEDVHKIIGDYIKLEEYTSTEDKYTRLFFMNNSHFVGEKVIIAKPLKGEDKMTLLYILNSQGKGFLRIYRKYPYIICFYDQNDPNHSPIRIFSLKTFVDENILNNFILNTSHKDLLLEQNKRYTIGYTTNEANDYISKLFYEFSVNRIDYKSELWLNKSENNLHTNKYFFVKYSSKDPSNCKLLIEKHVPDSIKKSPPIG